MVHARILAVGVAVLFISTPLLAQTSDSMKTEKSTGMSPSAAGKDTPPVAGANSFTQSQAMERIQKSGYTNVKNLRQDNAGVWRGDAEKAGQMVSVALDFRGNVVQK